MEYNSKSELMRKAKEAEGLTFGEIDQYGRLAIASSKGKLGQVIEESFFGYKINSDARPDFENLKTELKVTPYKKNKNGTLSAKERLVLNIINYMEEVNTEFHTSSFWHKNENLLMFFYEWMAEISPDNYMVKKVLLNSFSEADLEIIKQDWETIVNKIRDGKAHELSEGDTIYLGACTKGANKNSLRQQPYSDEKAMQRAYSLKQSYMTSIVRKYIQDNEMVSFASAEELKEKTFKDLLYEKFNPYIDLTDKEISEKLGVTINPRNKSFVPNLVSSLLGVKGTKLDNIAEFSKANIQFKTVRLEPSGKPKEHMSFEQIRFHEWVEETWEESFIREKFTETKFLFVVFEHRETLRENPNRKLYFKKVQLWNMPESVIENEVKDFWNEIHRILNTGVQLVKGSRGVSNNFPGATFNGVVHVRPKAANGADKVQLPDGQLITKQCFWLDRNYVARLIDNEN